MSLLSRDNAQFTEWCDCIFSYTSRHSCSFTRRLVVQGAPYVIGRLCIPITPVLKFSTIWLSKDNLIIGLWKKFQPDPHTCSLAMSILRKEIFPSLTVTGAETLLWHTEFWIWNLNNSELNFFSWNCHNERTRMQIRSKKFPETTKDIIFRSLCCTKFYVNGLWRYMRGSNTGGSLCTCRHSYCFTTKRQNDNCETLLLEQRMHRGIPIPACFCGMKLCTRCMLKERRWQL